MSSSRTTVLGTRRNRLISFLCLIVLAGGGWFICNLVSEGQPYEGKTLSAWIKQLRTGPSPRAKNVLKKAAPEKSVPLLVKALTSEPFVCSQRYQRYWTKLPRWIQKISPKPAHLVNFHWAITDVLLDFGPECKVALPELLTVVRKPHPPSNIVLQLARLNALGIIGSMGPEGQAALPTLWDLLKSEEAKPVMQRKIPIVNVAETIQKIDPQNLDLVLILIDWVENREGSGVKMRAVEILGRMGSAAKPAIPILKRMKDGQDEGLSNAADDALRAIGQ